MAETSSNRGAYDPYYDGFLGGKVFRWLDWSKLRILRRILADLGPDLRVLDLGCGRANVSSRLIGEFPGMALTGADQDSMILAKAEARGLKAVHVDFDRELPFGDGAFDVVMMIDTIEHVTCRRETMAEVSRILADGGTFIVFTPPYDTVMWTLGEKFHTLVTRRSTYDHISPFTRESLSWLLEGNFASFELGLTNYGLTLWGVGRGVKSS